MRVVRPHTPGVGDGRTLTATLLALRPSRADLVDAGFVLALGLLALLGFATLFEGFRYLLVSLIGLLAGLAIAHLANAVRLHWAVPPLAAVAAYLLLGPALAVSADAVFGFLPSIAAWRMLVGLAVGGWQELLTTLPPVAADSEYLALPLLLALLLGAVGLVAARRLRASWPPLIAPALVFALVLALGTLQPPALLVQGLCFVTLGLLWMMLRHRRRQQIIGSGRTRSVQSALGAGVLIIAVTAGALLGPLALGGTSRHVFRSYVTPPIEVSQYPTPLGGFRTFSSKSMKLYYDVPLMQVTGLAEGSRVRFAIMDAYTGAAWSATGPGDGDNGFQRLGALIPNAPTVDVQRATVEVLPAFAANPTLNVWLPSLGRTSTVTFDGPSARDHRAAFRYQLSTDQGLVPDRLRPGDVIQVSGAALPTFDAAATFDPGPSPLLGDGATSFLASYAQKLTGGTSDPKERLLTVAEALKAGAWSDGTKANETQYVPGHGIFRLNRMLQASEIVGSDEQYASAFALFANLIGYPSRVVMGAVLPASGQVTGKDVHAWVELQQADGQWVTVPDQVFTPDRNKTPKQTTNTPEDQKAATKVPPPNPLPPPSTTDEMNETQPSPARVEPKAPDNAWEVLLTVLAWAGPPVGVLGSLIALILGAKALRRRWRRTRGRPSTQIVGGWQEILDQARDLGTTVPTGQTRLEQSRTLGAGRFTELAEQANRAIFGAGEITAEQSSAFWAAVASTRTAMLRERGWWRGWRGRLNPVSLVTRGETPAERATKRRPRAASRATVASAGRRPSA